MKQFPLFIILLLTLAGCRSKGIDQELLIMKSGEKIGFINHKGDWTINPQFKNASLFEDGLASVLDEKGLWGYIDKKGKYKIEPQYQQATFFREGIAFVAKPRGKLIAIDTDGKELFVLENVDYVHVFSDGLALYQTDNLFGYINKKGEKVIPAQFDLARVFSNGLAPVNKKGKGFGYIDKTGKMIIPEQFNRAGPFQGDYAIVELKDAGYGTIDKKGHYVINPQFGDLITDGNLFIFQFKDGTQYGYCDKNGKVIINPQFDYILGSYDDNLISVCTGKQYGYTDKEGKIVINPQFQLATPFIGDIALVVMGGKIGFINRQGKVVVNPQFEIADTPQYEELFNLVKGDNMYREFYSAANLFFDIPLAACKIAELFSPTSILGLPTGTDLGSYLNKEYFKASEIRQGREWNAGKELNLMKGMIITPYMGGNLFTKESDGWWGYNYKLNRNAIPNISCKIIFSDNGYNCATEVLKELIKLYGLSNPSTNGNVHTYKINNQYLIVTEEETSLKLDFSDYPF